MSNDTLVKALKRFYDKRDEIKAWLEKIFEESGSYTLNDPVSDSLLTKTINAEWRYIARLLNKKPRVLDSDFVLEPEKLEKLVKEFNFVTQDIDAENHDELQAWYDRLSKLFPFRRGYLRSVLEDLWSLGLTDDQNEVDILCPGVSAKYHTISAKFGQLKERVNNATLDEYITDETIKQQVKNKICYLQETLWNVSEMQKPEPIDEESFEKSLNELQELLPELEKKIDQAELLKQKDDNKKLVAELKVLEQQLKAQVEDGKNTIVAATDDGLKKLGANRYAKEYEKIMARRECANYFWLFAILLFIFITIVTLSRMINLQDPLSQIPYNLSFSQLVLYGAPKLLLISVLVTATLWCGKMYKIGKNIEETHRRMAVGISNATSMLDKITEDKDLSSALYLTATRAMFSMPDSGYLTGKDEVALPADKLLEKVPSSGASSK